MAKKTLQIIDTPYRCTVEEQDDPAVWITHAMKGAGAELAVLLRGSAVNYGVRGQNAAGLRFGQWEQAQPPDIAKDVRSLIDKGIEVFLLEDDASERGLERTDLLEGIQPVSRRGLANLFSRYDQIWHW